jgi:acyl carrier protein
VIQTEQVSRVLRDFITEHFTYGRHAQLGEDDSLLEKGLIDSTGVLELVTMIEETYGFTVEDNELGTGRPGLRFRADWFCRTEA